MGDLLVLPSARSPSRSVPVSANAEILFFTGVRYYRFEDMPIAEAVAPKKRRHKAAVRRVRVKADPLRCELQA